MSSMVQCPNCKQMVENDGEFCIFCGTKLPHAKEPTHSIPEISSSKNLIRYCGNGHKFEDNDLIYCPICGLPLENKVSFETPDRTWRCSCGHDNPADNLYCEECGRSRKSKVPKSGGSESSRDKICFIPDGMYEPTDDDLKPKRGSKFRGN